MLQRLKKFSLPEIEEKVLKFWKTNGIFEKTNKQEAKQKKFVFYEGPPTANGRPGIHHVLTRAFKDIVLRYKTMAGFYVLRRGGWDTHGLPVEIEVEKELGLKSKADIEKYGIAEFNQKCRESVWKYKDEWEKLTERIGFWLDMDNSYITYESKYIETLWWIISQISKKKLLYKGHKVLPWCSRCGTGLSSHELALGYKEVEDTSIYTKFKLKEGQKIGNWKTGKNTYILSWTTTPWTLPGNVALAVGEKIKYIEQEIEGEYLIYAKDSPIAKELGETGKEIIGKNLVNLKYEPLFKIKPLQNKQSYQIYAADFVTTTEGAGVVHTAVMYGIDDYQLGTKVGLPQHHTVDEKGKFTKDVSGFAGMYVKDKKTEEKIITYLKNKNYLLKTENYKHEYPFCWRCNTALIYYARDSWFISMSKLRSKLLAANKKINWVPKHIKEGRFGEWIKEAKDWAFSRERYWGTPLPIWECKECGKSRCISSLEEVSKFAYHKSGNAYFTLRHGEADSNVSGIISMDVKDSVHLTELGKRQVAQAAKKLASLHIDYIFSSDFARTKETAEIVGKKLGIKPCYNVRLRELNCGELNGRKIDEYFSYYRERGLNRVDSAVPSGETILQVRERIMPFFNELEKKYHNKRILIVSHGDPLWVLERTLSGYSDDDFRSVEQKHLPYPNYPNRGEARKMLYQNLPRDENSVVDLHRPYIDKFFLRCDCSGKMERVKEVVDAWFDSGAMPFAQNHYPFEKSTTQLIDFPADYIVEGVDQTRGWFYTLLAIATLLNKKEPYRNVISLGLVLDKNNQKMSKSKGNVVSPWEMVEKYGADAVRWYFYTVNQPGEFKRFDEVDLQKTLRQFISLIYNSFAFFELYAAKKISGKTPKSSNVLDKWVIARLNETVSIVSLKLKDYEISVAAREIESFAGDLSRWYIRRSRRRLQKPDSSINGQKDYKAASETLGFVLLELSKLLAPFTPFFAEALYKSLVTNHKSSVHLTDWPKAKKELIDKKLLKEMEEVRYLASLALAKRAEEGVKVRQPLNELRIKSSGLKNGKILEVLKDEVNVKSVKVDKNLNLPAGGEIELDMQITHELKEEGWLREFVRLVQGLRQDAGLEPKDVIILTVELQQELHHVVETSEKLVKKEVNAKIVEYKRSTKFDIELETKINKWPVWVALRKLK